MKWTIIGTGRMGTALTAWLRDSGTPMAGWVTRRGLEGWLQGLAAVPAGGLLLAIPDDSLAGVAERLAAGGRQWRGWRALHTSGARPSNVLAVLGQSGAAVGSLHPMMTFGRMVAIPSPRGIVFSYEGDARACRAARELIQHWGGLGLPLSADAKARYHLAATLVGPGAVIAMAAAEHLLREAGLTGRQLGRARAGLVALLGTTQANLGQGTAAAWTGPMARGDWATVAQQRRQLSSPALRQLYEGMAASAAQLLPSGEAHPRRH